MRSWLIGPAFPRAAARVYAERYTRKRLGSGKPDERGPHCSICCTPRPGSLVSRGGVCRRSFAVSTNAPRDSDPERGGPPGLNAASGDPATAAHSRSEGRGVVRSGKTSKEDGVSKGVFRRGTHAARQRLGAPANPTDPRRSQTSASPYWGLEKGTSAHQAFAQKQRWSLLKS